MNLSDLRNTLPDYAKDLKPTGYVLSASVSRAWTTSNPYHRAVIGNRVTALAIGHAIEAFAAEQLSPEEINCAKAAAAIMAMNNIYYRATHLIHNDEYGQLRAGLRMNIMASPGVDKITFELASLAVSAINGCGMCMDSHERTIRQHEVSAQGVQSALKIGAVVHAMAVTLEQAEA